MFVEPVFPKKDDAIEYAQDRACFCSGEIRVLDSSGKLERAIALTKRIERCGAMTDHATAFLG